MTMRPALSFALLAAIAGLGIPPAAAAAQTNAGKKPPFVIEAGETPLTELIDRCAAYLQRNILWDDSEMQQAHSVRLQMPITTDDPGCEELLANMLYRAGFALTLLDDSQSIYEVIWMQGQRSREITQRAQHKTVQQILARPRLKVPVTTVVPLAHLNAVTATNALRPFFASSQSPGLVIGNMGASTSAVLSGMQDQVAAAIRMMQSCDVEQPPEPFRDMHQLPEYVSRLEKRLAALEKKLAKLTGKNR